MNKRQAPELPGRQIIRVPFYVGTTAEFRLEQRADGQVETLSVEGVASVYDYEYEVYGGPAHMGWIERIAKGAFNETLAENPDVAFLLNHEGLPLARTKSGTLELKAGKTGLEVRSELDLSNPLVQTLASALQRGDVDEMSFGFRVTKQAWEAHDDWPDDEMSLRTIEAVNLHRGDVSAVTFGANDATEIDVVRSLKLADVAELQKYQALIADRLGRAGRVEDLGAPDGTSEHVNPGGMPVHLLHLARL